MNYEPETPRATKAFLAERGNLFRAFEFDHDQGTSANDVARMGAGAISRPTILAHLTSRRLHKDAREALRAAGLDGIFGVEITDPTGRGSRNVFLMLAVDPVEVEQEPAVVIERAVRALREKGIRLPPPEEGDIEQHLWEGSPVRLHRPANP